MKGIKSSQYQNQIQHIFRINVLEGIHTGIHEIKEPDGFDAVNIIVDVNEEFFNVDNFILGETSKIKFIEHLDRKTFNIIKDTYDEFGGDAQILFHWIIAQNGQENDVLGEGFELNLNKYRIGYEKSTQYIECEIKKREVQNKFLAREDTTINLFATENIDGQPISPVDTTDIVFKSTTTEVKSMWSLRNYDGTNNLIKAGQVYREQDYVYNTRKKPPTAPLPPFFIDFNRSTPFEIGQISEDTAIWGPILRLNAYVETNSNGDDIVRRVLEVEEVSINVDKLGNRVPNKMLFTLISLENVKIRVSNLYIKSRLSRFKMIRQISPTEFEWETKPVPFSLWAGIIQNNTWTHSIKLKESELKGDYHQIEIPTSEDFYFGNIPANSELRVFLKIDEHKSDVVLNNYTLASYGAVFLLEDSKTAISVFTETETFSKKNKVVKLKDALAKVIENYSNGQLHLSSESIERGVWQNQVITTGYFLRGIADLPNRKLNTSFKSLFMDGVSPLFGMGYDIVDDKVVIEPISHFFKDAEIHNFQDKSFVQENLSIENDTEMSYNNLIFGTKKFSTRNKEDLHNFNTKMECITPIKSIKKKFDKTTSLILDEYKIQELIDDKSSATNDNDDDLIIIDTIYKGSFTDTATINPLTHDIEDGHLVLIDSSEGWGRLPLDVGDAITITEGYNIGEWIIVEARPTRLKLNKTSGVQRGATATKISFNISEVFKNRNATPEDGFIKAEGVKNKSTCSNLMHNPKNQLFRWFPYFSSGLTKKRDEDTINVTMYKNNGNVEVEPNATMISPSVGFSDAEILKENTPLEKLRKQGNSIFSGQKIEITLSSVNFEEFYLCYQKWKSERGFISVNVNNETINIYPIGANALDYDRNYRELTIRGKIKA